MDENSKDLDDGTSWYNERSNESSPSKARPSSVAMGLREGSLNQKSQPPLNSPLARQTMAKTMAPMHVRSDSVEQSRYIEHLESQLVSAQAKIDTLTSPKTNKVRSAKLRSLTVENRNLRNENSGWAKRAEEMVQEERSRCTGLEMELKARLEALEDNMEIKDARIGEFEWELESMRVQVRDAEGLEAANVVLEKKIDMLSNLLVHSPNKLDTSPTKLESRSTTTSPNKFSGQFSPSRRTPRPRSMMPKMPASPGARLSLASVSETAFWDSRSRSASIVATPEGSSPFGSNDEQPRSPISDDGMMSPDSSKRFSSFGSLDDRSNSTSYRTGAMSSSRPTSFMSTSSLGAPCWGVPNLPDGEARLSNRQRKMRRFPSGSNTLKPLILPTATGAPSLPVSAPIYPSIETVAKRDISNSSSIDPTTSFLTRLIDSSPYSTPTVAGRQRSTTWVQKQTLERLEGKHRNISAEMKEINDPESNRATSTGSSLDFGDISSGSQRRRRSRPKSLSKELEQAEIEQAHLNALGISAPDTFEDGLMPASRTSFRSQLPSDLQQEQCDATPRARPNSIYHNAPTTSPNLQARHRSSILVKTSPDQNQGLLSRLTELVAQTKQDPFILARRLLANAWTLGSSSVGGMGWWLIGPLHHHQRHRTLLVGSDADHAIDYRSSAKDSAKWQHFSAEIRNGRLVDGPTRDYGGTCMTPHHTQHGERNVSPPFVPGGRGEPHLFPCDECVEPSSRRTLRLWFQFSLTVVLAVGMAVTYGPGVLLAELVEGGHTVTCPRAGSERIQQQQRPDEREVEREERGEEDETIRIGSAAGKSRASPSVAESRDGADSGYGSIAFVEPLGPADFEAG